MRENQCNLQQEVCSHLRGGFRWSLVLPSGSFGVFVCFQVSSMFSTFLPLPCVGVDCVVCQQ